MNEDDLSAIIISINPFQLARTSWKRYLIPLGLTRPPLRDTWPPWGETLHQQRISMNKVIERDSLKLALAITAIEAMTAGEATTATVGAVHNVTLVPPPYFLLPASSESMPTSDGKKGGLSAAERKEKNELLLLLLLLLLLVPLLLLLLLPLTSSNFVFVCLFAVCLFVFL